MKELINQTFLALKELNLRPFFQVLRYLHITTVLDLTKLLFFIALIHLWIAFFIAKKYTDKTFVKISMWSAVFIVTFTTLTHTILYFSHWQIIKEAVLAPQYQVVFMLLIFINSINLLKMATLYIQENKRSKPDLDHVTRKHFRSTLNTTVLLTVLAGALISTTPFETGVLAFSTFTLTTACIWFNHLLARIYLVDQA